jgi:L-amino acid N-acyltransferase YncA
MTYTVRIMTDKDWPSVKSIYEAGIATGIATFETQAPPYEQWSQNSRPACRLVLEEQSQILGWCKVSAVSSRKAYQGVGEVSVYVHPDAKGKGIGDSLVKALIHASEQEGYWTLQANIFPENEASIHLHVKNGFREVGRREKIGKLAGVWRDNVLLERRSQTVGQD